jgi:hypothetical protein
MNLPSFDKNTLKGGCSQAGSNLRATLSGVADLPAQDALGQFVVRLHQAAVDAKTQLVELDLRELKFMSSSCFKVFVTWLTDVRELPADEQYRVRFVSDPAQHWQRRSLSALAAFGGDRVEIAA